MLKLIWAFFEVEALIIDPLKTIYSVLIYL